MQDIQDISIYSISIEERKSHLNLNDKCIERGGNSTKFQGILALYLNTNFPNNNKVILCHACNNDKCSNPLHLYWGTHKENTADAIKHGTHTNIWTRTVKKHGIEKALQMWGKRGEKTGKANKKRLNNISAGVGTQGELIPLSALDESSRFDSISNADTNLMRTPD